MKKKTKDTKRKEFTHGNQTGRGPVSKATVESEHFCAVLKGFGEWIVSDKRTGYCVHGYAGIFHGKKVKCKDRLADLEAGLLRDAERAKEYYTDDKVELEDLLAPAEAPLEAEKQAERDERIELLKECIAEYEKEHPTAAAEFRLWNESFKAKRAALEDETDPATGTSETATD